MCSSREKPSLLFIFPDFNSLVSGLWASVGVGDERQRFDIVFYLKTMWATTSTTTVSFPCYSKAKAKPTCAPPNSLSTFPANKRNSLKLKASFFDYPLASRIMVRSIVYFSFSFLTWLLRLRFVTLNFYFFVSVNLFYWVFFS